MFMFAHAPSLSLFSVHGHPLALFIFITLTPLFTGSTEKSLFMELKFSYHLTLPCGNNLISQGSSLCTVPTMLFCPLAFCSECFLYLLAKLLASPNIPCLFIAISPMVFIMSTPYSACLTFYFFFNICCCLNKFVFF